MIVRRAEECGIEEQPNRDPEIAAKHAVNEKTKNEFLGHRGDHDGQDDDHHALLNRLGAVEKIDNFLPARAAAEQTLRDRFGDHDERHGSKEKKDSRTK